MGKNFAGLIIIVLCVFVLEWFGIIDIPYVDLPDITIVKQEMVNKTDAVYYKIK